MAGKTSTGNIRNKAFLEVIREKLQIRLKVREFSLGKIPEEIHTAETTVIEL